MILRLTVLAEVTVRLAEFGVHRLLVLAVITRVVPVVVFAAEVFRVRVLVVVTASVIVAPAVIASRNLKN